MSLAITTAIDMTRMRIETLEREVRQVADSLAIRTRRLADAERPPSHNEVQGSGPYLDVVCAKLGEQRDFLETLERIEAHDEVLAR